MKKIVTALFATLVCASAVHADNRSSKILTENVALRVMGEPVKVGGLSALPDKEAGTRWMSLADYRSVRDANKMCTISISHEANNNDALLVFEADKLKFNGVPVSGYGEKAFRSNSQMPALFVLKGQNVIIFAVGTVAAGDAAKQESLARELLPKIAEN